MDQAGDSLGHYRQWQFQGHWWLMRGQNNPRLTYQGNVLTSKALADQLTYHWVHTVQVQGKPYRQYVAEVPVRLNLALKSNLNLWCQVSQ